MRKALFYLSVLLVATFSSCDNKENGKEIDVEVSTASATEVTSSTAKTGGTVSGDFSSTVTARGVCWATTENPTSDAFKTEDGEGKGTFESQVTGLSPSTTYYLRAYAVVEGKTFYGNQISFTTERDEVSVSTASATEVTSSTAKTGGTVSGDFSSAVTARGVCWATTENPTSDAFKTEDGEGKGTFESQVTGLSPSTMYYLRAYAVVDGKTFYGNQISFTTGEEVSGYDEGISNLTGDVSMPEMAGGGMMEYLWTWAGSFYWSIIIYNVGIIGEPDQTIMLEVWTPENDLETIPDGRYAMALYPDLAELNTAEPASFYDGDDYGVWYYADDGQGNQTSRVSSVGGKGFVEIERLSGSGEEADYRMVFEMYDTNGYKVSGAYEGYILNFSAGTMSPVSPNRAFAPASKINAAKSRFDAKSRTLSGKLAR